MSTVVWCYSESLGHSGRALANPLPYYFKQVKGRRFQMCIGHSVHHVRPELVRYSNLPWPGQ